MWEFLNGVFDSFVSDDKEGFDWSDYLDDDDCFHDDTWRD